eukprot:SAG31_NODE_309_length_17949_cov_11.083361_8_plen_101_part_00
MAYSKDFHRIHPNLEDRLQIGGVYLSDINRSHYLPRFGLEYFENTTKDALLKAIEFHSNGRKIKGLKSMNKDRLYQTLMKLDEFALVPSHANDKCVWHLS